MFKSEKRNFLRDAALAALVVAPQPMIFSGRAEAQTAASDSVIRWQTVGEHPFAHSMAEALNDAHLERVFATAVQEGQLTQADRAAFFQAAIAQRATLGTSVDVTPGTRFPWVNDERDPATGAGPVDVEWAGQVDLRVRPILVTRTTDGRVVRFGIVTETMDGTPCFNWLVLPDASPSVRVEAPAPLENPCPPRPTVSIEGLREGETVTVTYVIASDERHIPTEHNAQCPGVSLPDLCRDCTNVVARQEAQYIASQRRGNWRLFGAQSYTSQGSELHVGIEPTVSVALDNGQVVNIDVMEGLRTGVIIASISCPRTGHGRAQGNEHGVIIDIRDWEHMDTDDRTGAQNMALRLMSQGGQRVYRHRDGSQ